MNKIQFRWMEPDEVINVKDIDRSERIRTGYNYSYGKLQQLDVMWDSPSWDLEGNGDYSVEARIKFCQEHLDRNGQMFGAFDKEKLVGIGIIEQDIDVNTAQLAFLHVSNQYRQQGIGRIISEALIIKAEEFGAKFIYVSATPSESAVGFYLSQGFKPTDTPIPALFELEPEDIHMVKVLDG